MAATQEKLSLLGPQNMPAVPDGAFLQDQSSPLEGFTSATLRTARDVNFGFGPYRRYEIETKLALKTKPGSNFTVGIRREHIVNDKDELEPKVLLNISLVGGDITWDSFFLATANFVGDLSNVNPPNNWDGSFEFYIRRRSNRDGDDADRFDRKAPFDTSLVDYKKGDPFNDPNDSPIVTINVGSSFFCMFTMKRDAGKEPEVAVEVSMDDFIDRQKMLDDMGEYFARFNPDFPLSAVIKAMQEDLFYPLIEPPTEGKKLS
jgi:hypothetical protein